MALMRGLIFGRENMLHFELGRHFLEKLLEEALVLSVVLLKHHLYFFWS